MGLFVKICGLTSEEAVKGVVALKPDAIGFLFWPKSKRFVTPDDVAEWGKGVSPHILKVGVFVDSDFERIAETARRADLDVIQLHGNQYQNPEKDLPCDVWQVIHLDRMNADEAAGYRVDAFLVDSYSTESPGGTGTVCDWAAARRFVEKVDGRVILAGGLTPENVREGVDAVRPWGVDVSSGVEASPGVKDLVKVKAFVERCREK